MMVKQMFSKKDYCCKRPSSLMVDVNTFATFIRTSIVKENISFYHHVFVIICLFIYIYIYILTW